MAGRGAHGRHLKLDDICHPCLIETTFIWNYFKSTCRAHHLSSDSCQKRRLGFSWGANLTPILSLDPFTQQTHKKRLGTLSSAKASFYRRESWRGGKRKRGRGGRWEGEREEARNSAPSWMHYMAETPAFSLFPLSPALFLLFLLGYPAGALRGGERTRYESDLNWRVHSNPLFTCLCLLNFPISSFRFKVDKQSLAEARSMS